MILRIEWQLFLIIYKMSYTHIHLPHLDKLKKSLELDPTLLNFYSKYDSWIGSNESIKFLKNIINENR